VEEVRDSIRIIREILKTLPGGKIIASSGEVRPDHAGFAAVEGWRARHHWDSPDRGEINAARSGTFRVNWLDSNSVFTEISFPDFPLCNKSFNQSYSGNDL
jgi:Ni,Fe-hydrogenase III large subunit